MSLRATTAATLVLLASSLACGDDETSRAQSFAPGQTPSLHLPAEGKADAEAKIADDDASELADTADADAADPSALARTLERGRDLTRAGDYTAAQAAFEELLREDPEHIRGRAELGWAAYRAGDLGRAEAESLAALERASRTADRGMITYNLGRIVEARGEFEEAIGWYRQSIRHRPNDVVARRLASVELVEDLDRWRVPPVRVQAFVSLTAACETLRELRCEGEGEFACNCRPELSTRHRLGREDTAPSAGLLEVDMQGERRYLALETNEGWELFVVEGEGRASFDSGALRLGAAEGPPTAWWLHLSLDEGELRREAWCWRSSREAATGAADAPADDPPQATRWQCTESGLTRAPNLELWSHIDATGHLVIRQRVGEPGAKAGAWTPGRRALEPSG